MPLSLPPSANPGDWNVLGRNNEVVGTTSPPMDLAATLQQMMKDAADARQDAKRDSAANTEHLAMMLAPMTARIDRLDSAVELIHTS